jgi:AcrR family transcriptional regulator
MLNMRSVSSGRRVPEEDLSTRARIRDAAILRFGSDGLGAPLRLVAADAGVSPALVIHHFGSKDRLRAACDEHVLRRVREAKSAALGPGGPAALLTQMATVEQYAPLVEYVLRSLLAGGELAASFVEQMVRDAEQYLAAGVAAGTIRPSRDPSARARYLVMQSMGGMLLEVQLHGAADAARLLRSLTERITLPALEIFTEGLMTDRSMLDAYLTYVSDPPAGETGPGASRG